MNFTSRHVLWYKQLGICWKPMYQLLRASLASIRAYVQIAMLNFAEVFMTNAPDRRTPIQIQYNQMHACSPDFKQRTCAKICNGQLYSCSAACCLQHHKCSEQRNGSATGEKVRTVCKYSYYYNICISWYMVQIQAIDGTICVWNGAQISQSHVVPTWQSHNIELKVRNLTT